MGAPSVSYRWDIEEDGAGATGDERGAAAARVAEAQALARARRRLSLTLLLATALIGSLLLGWRYWQGRRLLARIEADISAAVRLEERALAEGDAELYRRQQSLSRARQLSHARDRAGERLQTPPPQPGLSIAPAPGSIEAIVPETDLRLGQPIRRATVHLRYVVSDSLGAGRFDEPRPYALSDKGRWIHTTHDDAIAAAEPLHWEGRYLDVRFLPADAERMPPILAHAEALLERYCAASAACDLPARLPGARRRPASADVGGGPKVGPARLSLTRGLTRSGGVIRHEGQRYLWLPAPALTLVPADADGEALLLRHLTRLAILWLADEASDATYIDAHSQPVEGLHDHASLLNALIDAWLALALGLDLPEPPPLAFTPPPGAAEEPLSGLWGPSAQNAVERGFYGYDGDSDPRIGVMLRGFARHLAGQGDAAGLARLIGELPRAESLDAWLAHGFGTTAGDLLASWHAPVRPFPADHALVMSCSGIRQTLVLLRPESVAPRSLDHDCGPGARASDAAWRPGGAALALACEASGDGFGRVLILDGAATREAPEALRFPPVGAYVHGPLRWSADGSWLLWREAAVGGDEYASNLVGLAVPAEGATGRERPVVLAELRSSEDAAAGDGRRDGWRIADHAPFRAAPDGAALAFEATEGRVGVLDLDPAGTRERWRSPGSDPVWSEDGRYLSVLRLDAADAFLVVLDAATGGEVASAEAGLPTLLQTAADALGDAGPAASAGRVDLRLRVGQSSPEGRWASLVAALRVQLPRREATEGYDWNLLLVLDTATGRVLRASTRGDAYFDGREGFVRWAVPGQVWLSHFDPGWWPNLAEAAPRPAATRLDLASGEVEVLSVDAVRRVPRIVDAAPQDPLAAGEASAISPDGRWLLRGDSEFDSRASIGRRLRSQLIDLRDGSVDWTLDAAYCAEPRWQP